MAIDNDNIMSEEIIVRQSDYISYHQSVLNAIGNNILNSECEVIFVTEFGYENDNCDKVVYFRKGNSYQKLIIPMNADGTMDIESINVRPVDDINEIKHSIGDCEAEFGVIANAPEYARILSMSGEEEKAQILLNKWNYFLSKQDELDQIRERVLEQHKAFKDDWDSLIDSFRDGTEMESNDEPDFDTPLNNTIDYGNVVLDENGIIIINPNGTIKFATDEEEKEYISQIKNAVENGEITLTSEQLELLESYSKGSNPKM